MRLSKLACWLALPAAIGISGTGTAQVQLPTGGKKKADKNVRMTSAQQGGAPKLAVAPSLYKGVPLPPKDQILEIPTGSEERFTVAPYRLVAEPYSTRKDVADVKLVAAGEDETQSQLPQLITIKAAGMGESTVVLPLLDESTGTTFERRLSVLVIDQISPAFREHMVATIRRLFPSTHVDVIVMNGRSVLLTGHVDRAELVQVIEDFVQSSLSSLQRNAGGAAAGGAPGGGTGVTVVNALRVVDSSTVQLKVVFASINRTKLRNLGMSWRWEDLSGPVTGNLALQLPGSQAAASTLPFFVTRAGVFSYAGFLQALQTQGLGKILAEPTLTALSGSPAFFNAGQQFPIVSPGATVLGGAGGGGGQLGGGSVTFVPIGTNLRFVPTVLGNGRIRLEVRPEVSEFIREVSTPGGGTAPVIAQRVAETTVELESGQTFVLAGLTRQQTSADVAKLPFVGDIPLVGWAFQQKTYNQQEEELVIMVTPYFVDAIDEQPCKLPGRESRIPNDVEFFIGSKIEPPCFPDPYRGDWKKTWQPPTVQPVPPYDNRGRPDESFLSPRLGPKPVMIRNGGPAAAGSSMQGSVSIPPTGAEPATPETTTRQPIPAVPVIPKDTGKPESVPSAKPKSTGKGIPPVVPAPVSPPKTDSVKKTAFRDRSSSGRHGDDLLLPDVASESTRNGSVETEGWKQPQFGTHGRTGKSRRDAQEQRMQGTGRVLSLIPKDGNEPMPHENVDESGNWRPATKSR
jgi:Flp pilus assembly secretin CpaC